MITCKSYNGYIAFVVLCGESTDLARSFLQLSVSRDAFYNVWHLAFAEFKGLRFTWGDLSADTIVFRCTVPLLPLLHPKYRVLVPLLSAESKVYLGTNTHQLISWLQSSRNETE